MNRFTRVSPEKDNSMEQELARIKAFINGLEDPQDRLDFCAKIQGIQRSTRTVAHRALGATNYGKRYTDAEKHDIITLTLAGYTKQEIAIAMNRTVIGATQQRQKVLVTAGENTSSIAAKYPSTRESAFEMLAPQHNNLDGC